MRVPKMQPRALAVKAAPNMGSPAVHRWQTGSVNMQSFQPDAVLTQRLSAFEEHDRYLSAP
jgi:hypothetical protein